MRAIDRRTVGRLPGRGRSTLQSGEPTIILDRDPTGGFEYRGERQAMRRIVGMALLAVAVVGCGDALGGVGDLSREFVHGDDTTTTTDADAEPELGLEGITEVIWVNDALDARAAGTGDALIRAIWERGDRLNPFVQASRVEVAEALTGIRVPKLVPRAVTHISSQLVYDPQTGLLDAATSAAFGYWSAEPYTAPRSEAQLLVLRVGLATTEETASLAEVAQFNVEGGRELAWVEGDYVYQLFCRTGVSEEACFTIADSTGALVVLIPVSPNL